MDANAAYYCFHKQHKWPSEYLVLPCEERAFVVAAIQIKLKHDKEEARKIRAKK